MNEEVGQITTLINSARPLDEGLPIVSFAKQLYQLAIIHKETGIGSSLAALFDLAVTALYLQKLGDNGWIYCKDEAEGVENAALLYPFVNACPRCTLRNKFVFTPSRKPSSGVIGQATSLILTTFLNEHASEKTNGRCKIHILGGSGVVDAIGIEGNKISLFEIKSAPLITFPVMANTILLSVTDTDGELTHPDHKEVTLPADYAGDLSIIISEDLTIPIGVKSNDESEIYNQLIKFLTIKENFNKFVSEWENIFAKYRGEQPKTGTFWLTNGCGQPMPRPLDWEARRTGSGWESISDGKSSVGLDRTDDIKKGIYQVMKIGTHFKEFSKEQPFEVFTILASNIHAVKHHGEYLKEFEDMMWTIDAKERTYVINRDNDQTVIKSEGLYNLYDGLITFTNSHYRSDWVKETFGF